MPAREAKMVPSGAVVEVMLVSDGGVRDSVADVKGPEKDYLSETAFVKR